MDFGKWMIFGMYLVNYSSYLLVCNTLLWPGKIWLSNKTDKWITILGQCAHMKYMFCLTEQKQHK